MCWSILSSVGTSPRCANTSVTLAHICQVSHEDFFSLPEKEDVLSHLLKAWKISRARHFGPKEPAMVCTGTYLKLSPTPKPIHSSLAWIGRYNAIANTTISMSTVLIMIVPQLCWTASFAWRRSLVFASSGEHGYIWSILSLSGLQRTDSPFVDIICLTSGQMTVVHWSARRLKRLALFTSHCKN